MLPNIVFACLFTSINDINGIYLDHSIFVRNKYSLFFYGFSGRTCIFPDTKIGLTGWLCVIYGRRRKDTMQMVK